MSSGGGVRDLRPRIEFEESDVCSTKTIVIIVVVSFTLTLGLIFLFIAVSSSSSSSTPTTTTYSAWTHDHNHNNDEDDVEEPTFTYYPTRTFPTRIVSLITLHDDDYNLVDDDEINEVSYDDTITSTTTNRPTTTSTTTTTPTTTPTTTTTTSPTTTTTTAAAPTITFNSVNSTNNASNVTSSSSLTTTTLIFSDNTSDSSNTTLNSTMTATTQRSETTTSSTTTTTTTSTSAEEDYFSYALNHSSLIRVSGKDDFVYGDFYIPGGTKAFGHIFSSFSISNDGRVSMRSLRGFSLIIKAFDSDLDLRHNGSIHHGRVDRADLITAIADDVNRLCNREVANSFVPVWAYVVTWFETRPYFRYLGDPLYGAKSSYKNTFQALLTTDNEELYVFYNYIQMDWPNLLIDNVFESGYSTWDMSFRSTSSLLETRQAQNLIQKSNMGRPGRWFLSFNSTNCRKN